MQILSSILDICTVALHVLVACFHMGLAFLPALHAGKCNACIKQYIHGNVILCIKGICKVTEIMTDVIVHAAK